MRYRRLLLGGFLAVGLAVTAASDRRDGRTDHCH